MSPLSDDEVRAVIGTHATRDDIAAYQAAAANGTLESAGTEGDAPPADEAGTSSDPSAPATEAPAAPEEAPAAPTEPEPAPEPQIEPQAPEEAPVDPDEATAADLRTRGWTVTKDPVL